MNADYAQLRAQLQQRERQLTELQRAKAEADARAAEATHRLEACEAAVDGLRGELVALLRRAEGQEVELLELHREAIAATSRIEALTAASVAREAADDALLLHNRGKLAYLGLRVVADVSGGMPCVVIREVRGPALEAGVLPGDVLQHVSVTADFPIASVNAYRSCVADMPLDAEATVSVRRGGGQARHFSMRPEVVVDRAHTPASTRDIRSGSRSVESAGTR
jgi:multidrug efflux pump subunit AcrA (membrane-fusion protein)